MSDEHFWHVYFTLARKHLPEAAYSWGPDDPLPSFEGAQPPLQMQMQMPGLQMRLCCLTESLPESRLAVRLPWLHGWPGTRIGWKVSCRLAPPRVLSHSVNNFAVPAAHPALPLPLCHPTADEAAGEAFSLTSLSSQLKQLGSKLQSASASGRQRAGLELSNLVSSVRGDRGSPGAATAAASSSPGAEAGGDAAGTAGAAAGVAGAAAGEAKAPPAGMLEEDPDLEAYLQVGAGAARGWCLLLGGVRMPQFVGQLRWRARAFSTVAAPAR